MSHALTQRANGTVEFAYRADHGQPWHGLGQAIPEQYLQDPDYWRKAAGMDWRVCRSRVRFGEGASQQTWDDHHVLFRSDNKHPLGIVSDGYKIVQPAQIVEFFHEYVHVAGFELSAMGTLFDGARFWATALIGEACPLSKNDKIKGFVLLATSADGSMSTEGRNTSTRVVCDNTLQMARRGAASFKLSHRSVFDPEDAKKQMGISQEQWREFKANIIRLANKDLQRVGVAEDLTAMILADSTDEAAMQKVRESARSGYDKVLGLFRGMGAGSREDGVWGTAWGLVNAFTEYADHHASARTDENRFASSQWGANADLKTRAFDKLLALV